MVKLIDAKIAQVKFEDKTLLVAFPNYFKDTYLLDWTQKNGLEYVGNFSGEIHLSSELIEKLDSSKSYFSNVYKIEKFYIYNNVKLVSVHFSKGVVHYRRYVLVSQNLSFGQIVEQISNLYVNMEQLLSVQIVDLPFFEKRNIVGEN